MTSVGRGQARDELKRSEVRGADVLWLAETWEERMDQGELELLAATLPNDLAQYLMEDNEAFQKEIVDWRIFQ